ncbi:hypothetical protein GCM10022261_02870 [Brevibacterium daeguense]|uniref:D-3-phosphoglycerate dehydrogenase n=1 Tax=Brevibacterium daeguense TaxID=909936 RepID=A0ABP8EFS0_9MICO|nr:hydroxyacid dehydrogenase [Brevibacterium daeguense]
MAQSAPRTFYVSDPIHPEVLGELSRMGHVHLGFGDSAVDYRDVAAEVDAVLLRAENFDRAKIEMSPKLRIIARHGVGTDNVDIDAATASGVWVTTAPGSNSRAVAEHVFALLLSLARRVPFAAASTAAGHWTEAKPELVGFELHGRTLGLVGFGSISRMVTGIARGFGMQVIVHDPFVDDAQVQALAAESATLSEVLTRADVISLHLPLTSGTAHLIDSDALAAVKPGSVLINTSRGGVVDERALVEALRQGRLAAAALDVIEGESVDMRNPLAHSPIDHSEVPNLIVTPHVAGQTAEAFKAAGVQALAAIREALKGQRPAAAINNA